MLIGHKWLVYRDVTMGEVLRKCGVNLLAIASDTEIPIAMTALEELRFNGVPHEGPGSK